MQIYKDWRVMEHFVVTTEQMALLLDTDMNVKPVTVEVNNPKEILSLFSMSSYSKGKIK